LLATFVFFSLLSQDSWSAENLAARFSPNDVSVNRFRASAALPIESRILGVRNDPLAVYQDDVNRLFPQGVPLSETAFALELIRARKANEIIHRGPASDRGDDRPPVSNNRRPPAPVRTISLDAYAHSSPGKIDWNQLVVEVRAYDRDDKPTTIRGTLRASLWGQSQQLIRSFERRVVARTGPIKEIATWTRSVGTAKTAAIARRTASSNNNLTPPSLRLLLPLPYPLPEHDLRLAPLVDLHVQLLVPGQGVFESTRPGILLRQVSEVRDRNLVQTGSRFLSSESTHDSRRPSGLRIQNRSSLRPNGSVLSVQP